jgi:hypothetical protein
VIHLHSTDSGFTQSQWTTRFRITCHIKVKQHSDTVHYLPSEWYTENVYNRGSVTFSQDNTRCIILTWSVRCNNSKLYDAEMSLQLTLLYLAVTEVHLHSKLTSLITDSFTNYNTCRCFKCYNNLEVLFYFFNIMSQLLLTCHINCYVLC